MSGFMIVHELSLS